MRWKEPKHGTYYLTKRFAWFPTTTRESETVWLESYWELTKFYIFPGGGTYYRVVGLYSEEPDYDEAVRRAEF